MKRIFAMAIIGLSVTVFTFACQKAGDSNSNQKTVEANSNKADEAKATQDDTAQLLKDLIDTVHRFNTARNTGDTATQEQLLANEFSAEFDGKIYKKADWIDSKGLANFAAHKVENAELLSHTQYTASLGYDGKTTYTDGTPSATSRFIVGFVKRDGRWQIKSLAE